MHKWEVATRRTQLFVAINVRLVQEGETRHAVLAWKTFLDFWNQNKQPFQIEGTLFTKHSNQQMHNQSAKPTVQHVTRY